MNFNYLTESGIKFPIITDEKGNKVEIKSAKILSHKDLDGIISAILTYNQLIRQGIPAENIYIEPIQYGDWNLEKKLSKNPGEGKLIALVDFATIDSTFAFLKQNKEYQEKLKELRPHFWSDHHSARMDYTKKQVDSVTTIMQQGAGRPGQTEFKSEAEHLLTKTLGAGMIDPIDIKAISVIDSAGYKNLIDVIDLPEIKDMLNIELGNKPQEIRKEKLATVLNALVTKNIIGKDDIYRSLVMTTKEPLSLIKIYRNVLKHIELAHIQYMGAKEINKKKPDMDIVNKARISMPTREMAEKIKIGTTVSEPKSLEKMRTERQGSIQVATSEKNPFEKQGNVLVQKISGMKLQRYMWSFLHDKEGTRYPFVLKEFPTLIQVAVNPDLSTEEKSKVDLNKIREKIVNEVKWDYIKKWRDKYKTEGLKNWSCVFDEIADKSGGHKSITNIVQLSLSGKPDKEIKKDLKVLDKAMKRKTTINKEDLERLKDIKERLNIETKASQTWIGQAIEKLIPLEIRAKEIGDEIKANLKKAFIRELNKLKFSVTKEGLDNRFKLKESFINKLKTSSFIK